MAERLSETLPGRPFPPALIEASWPLFLVAALAVILTPGQDTILVLSRSLSQGASAGVVTALGVSLGLAGHTILAALGVGALLRASEGFLVAFKLAGAGYLAWLGLKDLLSRRASMQLASLEPRPAVRLLFDGALSNLLNPYVVLFFFAFMPQFVSPAAAHPTLTIFALGFAYAAMAFMAKGPVALFSGWLSTRLRDNPQALAWVRRSSGAVLLALAIRLALGPA